MQVVGSDNETSIQTETPFAAYRDDPVGFVEQILGETFWTNEAGEQRQLPIALDVAQHPRTSVATGHGVGKTWLASRIALWFNQTRPFSRVITTAPKWEQVEGLIWQEIRQGFYASRTPLLGKCLTTDLKVAPNWYVQGLNTDDPIKFQGHHAPGGVLLIVDEASGFPEQLYEAGEGFLTQPGCKVLLIGNPNVRYGTFFTSFGNPDWRNHRIASTDAPRWMVTQSWIDSMRRKCMPDPESHPIYQVRVAGEFPDNDESGLFPISLLERSGRSTPAPDGRHMGVDVARQGGDRCVALLLVDRRVSAIHSWEKCSLMKSASIVRRLMSKWRVPVEGGYVHVDTVGLGAGVVDRLTQIGVDVDPVDFGQQAPKGEMLPDPEDPQQGSKLRGDWIEYVGERSKFKNLRAELHWSARRLLEEGQLAISENYREVWNDLQAIPFRFDGAGQIELPPKEKIKALIGRSPDFSDALCIALSRPRRATLSIVAFPPRSRRVRKAKPKR